MKSLIKLHLFSNHINGFFVKYQLHAVRLTPFTYAKSRVRESHKLWLIWKMKKNCFSKNVCFPKHFSQIKGSKSSCTKAEWNFRLHLYVCVVLTIRGKFHLCLTNTESREMLCNKAKYLKAILLHKMEGSGNMDPNKRASNISRPVYHNRWGTSDCFHLCVRACACVRHTNILFLSECVFHKKKLLFSVPFTLLQMYIRRYMTYIVLVGRKTHLNLKEKKRLKLFGLSSLFIAL